MYQKIFFPLDLNETMLSYVQIWTKETVFPPELNELKLSKCPSSRVIIITVVAMIIMKEGISCIDMLSTDTRRLPHRARFPGQDLLEVHLEHM